MNPLQRQVLCGDLLSGPKGVMEQDGQREVSDQLSTLIPVITTYNLSRSWCSDTGNGIYSTAPLQLGKVERFIIGSGLIPLGGWVLSRYALVLHGVLTQLFLHFFFLF